MIRFTKSLAVAAVAFMLPTVASALGVSIVSQSESIANDGIIEVGETITIDLRLENATDVRVYGLDLIAFGYDETASTAPTISSGLTNVGGTLAQHIFTQIPGSDLGGLDNVLSAPQDLFTVNNLNPEVVRTRLFGGISTDGTPGNGEGDNGVNGSGLTNAMDGGIHFQVTFQNIPTQSAASHITLTFGTNSDLNAVAVGNGGVVLSFDNASTNLTVIPEPGTALLMGLGLVGLASNRRR